MLCGSHTTNDSTTIMRKCTCSLLTNQLFDKIIKIENIKRVGGTYQEN